MFVTRSTTPERGLVWLAALILAFGAMVPLASRMPVRAASPDLFFSEYIEGSSNNKAIEIFNGTGAAVNLSGYTLELYSNGSPAPTQTLAPSGTVADGDVYVIAHTLSNSLIQAQADLLIATVVTFNGDDAVVLKHNGVVIHENLEITGPTGGHRNDPEGTPGPIKLQGHGNPLQFRNIWIVEKP